MRSAQARMAQIDCTGQLDDRVGSVGEGGFSTFIVHNNVGISTVLEPGCIARCYGCCMHCSVRIVLEHSCRSECNLCLSKLRRGTN